MSWVYEYPPCIWSGDIAAARDFYVGHFCAEIVLDLGWYLVLNVPGCTQTLRFMASYAAQRTNRAGLTYNLEVSNIHIEFDRLHARRIAPLTPIRTHAWGDRFFFISDPCGVLLQIFSPGLPTPEFLQMMRTYD